MLYGENSDGAEALATQIRSIKFEIQAVILALKELEKMDSWSDFKPLENPEQTKYDNTKIDENVKRKH